MSYGLRVDGTDSGGTFIVTDTDKDLVNLQVVEVGTATHVLNLDSPLGPTDFLFVKNPSAANGSYESYTKLYNTLNGYQQVSFTHPQFYYCTLNVARTQITFQGGAIDSVDFGYQSGPVGIVYRGFDVKFDYFIVRDVGEIIADNLQASGDYGLQVFTSNGDIAFDSRAVITNNTFAINSAAQPGGSSSPSTNTSLFTFGESGSYVNIEWTAFGSAFHQDGLQDADGGFQGAGVYVRGAGITNSGCYIYDGFLDAEPGAGFYWFPVQYAVYGATLHTGAPSGGGTSGGGTTSGGDGTGGSSTSTASGTLNINSSTFLEGEDIVFTATTTISGDYNIQIERISGESGSTGEFTSPHTTFNGTSKTHTVSTVNDSTKELGWQGESFTATLRTGSTVGSGTDLASVSFSLYDNDGYTELVGATGTKYTIGADDTFAAPTFFYQSQGTTGSIPARIRIGSSSGTIIKTFNLPDGVNETVQIDTNLPPELSTYTYVLQLYTGSSAEGWRDARTFYIEREQDVGLTGTIPTSSATPLQGSQLIGSGEIDYSQTFTGMTAGEQIRVTNSTGTVTQTTVFDVPAGDTSITISGIPAGSAGTTVTHRAQVRRNAGNWVNKDTYTVTRQQAGGDGFGGGLD